MASMHKEIRTKINQTAHLLAQREFARIRLELMTLCEQLLKAGKSYQEVMQAIDKSLWIIVLYARVSPTIRRTYNSDGYPHCDTLRRIGKAHDMAVTIAGATIAACSGYGRIRSQPIKVANNIDLRRASPIIEFQIASLKNTNQTIWKMGILFEDYSL
jgi:hypothetical protein